MKRGRGEGSIYQRHDHESCPPIETDADGDKFRPEHRCRGRWVANLDLGWSAGKRRRKVVYGATKRDVQSKLSELHKTGARPSGGHTVETWMTYWLDEVVDVKPQTMRSYRSKVTQYIVPLLGRHRLDKLEPRHVRDMYKRMRQACPRPDAKTGKCPHSPSHGLSEKTLRQTHAILRRALTIAVREEQAHRNVALLIDSPGTETGSHRALSLAEANAVLRAASDDPQEARWYAALVLGMRQGECLGLTWEWVNLDEGVLFIERTLEVGEDGKLVAGTPKSQTSRRAIPLPANVLSRLRVEWARHVEAERKSGHKKPRLDVEVWRQQSGKPWHPKQDYNHWQALLKAAGVERAPLHGARDTTAKLLEQLGVPARLAQEILGHAHVSVTYGYQADAALDVRREAMDKLAELGAGAPDAPATDR